MTRVLLTGAGGFVGSHVLRHILGTTNWDVIAPVTFRHRGNGDRLRRAVYDLDHAANRLTVDHVDLAMPISATTADRWGDIDFVLNLASESHVDRSITHPAPFIMNNVALMVNLLEWARQHDSLRAFLQISTDEVYGAAPEDHRHVEWEPHLPSNPYSASKAAQEDIAFAYWRTYGVPLVVTNTMNIIGETQDREKFFPMVLNKVLRGEKVPLHAAPDDGDDRQIGSRFYLHARNQADALIYLLRRVEAGHLTSGNAGEALYYDPAFTKPWRFNIVGEREVTNLEMAQMIADAAGKPLNYELVDFHSSRPGHDLRYALDGNRLAQIGWEAPVPLEESVRRTVRWTLNHPEWLNESVQIAV